MGYAAIAVLAATRRPGIDVVLEFTGLADRLAGADLVITGEGSLDEQSLLGKTPMGVARAAAAGRRSRDRRVRADHPDAGTGRRTPDSDTVYALTALETNVEQVYSRSRTAAGTIGYADQRGWRPDGLPAPPSTKEDLNV